MGPVFARRRPLMRLAAAVAVDERDERDGRVAVAGAADLDRRRRGPFPRYLPPRGCPGPEGT